MAHSRNAADRNDEDEPSWAALLDYIESGSVVPLVGRDLLVFETTDEQGRLVEERYDTLVSRELARDLKVTIDVAALSGRNPLGAVAFHYIVAGGIPNAIYARIPKAMARVDERLSAKVPAALSRLAEIAPFKFFATATCDSVLERCIHGVRGVSPTVLSYNPGERSRPTGLELGSNRERIVQGLNERSQPIVAHLFGTVSSVPNYAVTDEDAFEFTYSLLHQRTPEMLELLSELNLLIIGCRFPNWLFLPFLRVLRQRRLLQSPLDRVDFVVDGGAGVDIGIARFLRTFRTQVETFTSQTPTEFVDELNQRWQQRSGATADAGAEPCSVIISHASEDAVTAESVASQLRQAGLPVWFDRRQLSSADDWSRRIRQNIEHAGAFVPLLSRAVENASGSRWFRREWRLAVGEMHRMPAGERFIFPLAVGNVSRESEQIDQELRALNWADLDADGTVPRSFIDALRRAYRTCQMHGRR